MKSHIESLTLGRAATTGQDVPQEAPVTLLSTTLHRPETSGWLVKKEGCELVLNPPPVQVWKAVGGGHEGYARAQLCCAVQSPWCSI